MEPRHRCHDRASDVPVVRFFPRVRRDEEDQESAALCDSYLKSAVKALIFYANTCSTALALSRLGKELREARDMRKEIPQIQKLVCEAELMPLWRLLQSVGTEDARTRRRLSMAVVVALHACLISVREVQGSKRCKQVASATRRTLKTMEAQLKRANQADVRRASASSYGDAYVWYACAWLQLTNLNHSASPIDHATGVASETAAKAKRVRDHALLCTPWVAGQTLLVATLGIGIGMGSVYVDTLKQASLVLRLHRGLRRASILGDEVR